MKIGVFGGTFNPPHVGHLIVTESMLSQIELKRLLFVPSANPPHKPNLSLASAYDRFAMTELAIEGHSVFEVSNIEIERQGKSYTIDTLKSLKIIFPRAEFFLIIGADSFIEMETWKSPDEIFTIAEVIVLSRPGFTNLNVRRDYQRRARFVNVPLIGISGTDIRRRVKHKQSIRYLVPPSVEEYIYSHKLYQT